MTRRVPALRDYQRRGVEFLRWRRKAILADDMGLGKSCQAILAAEVPAIVLCPASLVVNWRREVEAWRPAVAGAFTVVSYADPHLAGIDPRDFRTVVVDEAHYLKSPGSRRSRFACRLVRQCPRAYALSGTLVPNRPIELWPLLRAMGIYPKSFEAFAYRYCAGHLDAWGALDARGASRLDELRELLRPHVLRRTKAEVWPELPRSTWRVVALDLPAPEREKGFSLEELGRMPEPVALEAMSSVLRVHGERKAPLAAAHVRDVLEGGVRKVLVFGYHRDVLERLWRDLGPYGTALVRGGQAIGERVGAIDRFQGDPACRVLVGQVTAAGVGLNLTAADHVVFAEASWVPAVLEQAADRPRKGTVVDLLTISNSIDEHMLRRALEKQRVVEAIVPVGGTSTPDVSPRMVHYFGESGIRDPGKERLSSTPSAPARHPPTKGDFHVSDTTKQFEDLREAGHRFVDALVDAFPFPFEPGTDEASEKSSSATAESTDGAQPTRKKASRKKKPPKKAAKGESAGSKPALDDVVKEFYRVVDAYGSEGVKQVLEGFGVKNVSALEPGQFADAIAAARKYVEEDE